MSLIDFLLTKCEGKDFDSCVDSPCRFASADGCAHPEHPKHRGGLIANLAQLNHLLIEANQEQTRRCRRMSGAVRLLGEVLEEAEPCEEIEPGDRVLLISMEMYERIAAFLADFHAVEAESACPAKGAEPECLPAGGEQ